MYIHSIIATYLAKRKSVGGLVVTAIHDDIDAIYLGRSCGF